MASRQSGYCECCQTYTMAPANQPLLCPFCRGDKMLPGAVLSIIEGAKRYGPKCKHDAALLKEGD